MGTALSSGLVAVTSATQVGHTGKQKLNSITAIGDGTNAATVTVYDNGSAAASGTVLAQAVVAASTTNRTVSIVFNTPVRADNGLVIVVAGTGAQGHITYGG